MRRLIIAVSSILFIFLLVSTTHAIPLNLTIESYDPATFSTVSTIIDIPDVNDQLEISRQAALFALSSDGWDIETLDGVLAYRGPTDWSDQFYFIAARVSTPVSSDIIDLFGYALNGEALTYDPSYYLYFHTDNWVARYSHDVGESLDNYGVIGGGSGGYWVQCIVPDWGRFYVEEIEDVPEPATILLLGFGLIGLRFSRRVFKS